MLKKKYRAVFFRDMIIGPYEYHEKIIGVGELKDTYEMAEVDMTCMPDYRRPQVAYMKIETVYVIVGE